jgi:copper chaperone CopZ
MRALALALILLFGLATHAPAFAGATDPPRTTAFHVKGMTCALCGKAIDRAIRSIDGVASVVIDAKNERVTVLAAPAIDPKTIEAAIHSAGGFQIERLPDR